MQQCDITRHPEHANMPNQLFKWLMVIIKQLGRNDMSVTDEHLDNVTRRPRQCRLSVYSIDGHCISLNYNHMYTPPAVQTCCPLSSCYILMWFLVGSSRQTITHGLFTMCS